MIDLNSEVSFIKGIGPKTVTSLKKTGLGTIRDLLYYFPRDYEDYYTPTSIADLRPGKVIVKGRIKDLRTHRTGRNFTLTEGEIYDDTGSVRVVWFNQPYRAKSMDKKKEYFFSGNFDFKYQRYQLTAPNVTQADELAASGSKAPQPIYAAKGNLNSIWFQRLFEKMRDVVAETPDFLPFENAPDFIHPGARADAMYNIHFPENFSDVETAREYLAYEELFELILAAELNKNLNTKLTAESLPFDAKKTKDFISSLPFKLTNAQRLAAWEILQDLEKKIPMNRLLQGDVGSGKTIVAAIAAHQAVSNGHQVALIAPTAILATQHYESLQKFLEPFGIKCRLLVAATKNKPKLKAEIASGKIDFVIGTHAVLTDDTAFKSLALCIVDEQHRFGVRQRQKLLEKSRAGLSPHFLAMTATPIPRSLQLTVFGDLDVSIIAELPKGRQKIATKIINEVNMRDELYPEIQKHLDQKEQVYWICKLIEESKVTETADVKRQTEKLRKIFPKAKIEYLHGRMKGDEKDAIMANFAAGKIDILVSTTVVEVGVDVPNATQIVIMDAESYGLAQLHQLRGRVGRGTKASSCYLIKTGDERPSRRIRELEKSTDGFHLAEVDLKIRGPGEIYGKLQHGTLNLRIATLADTQLIHLARKHAADFAKHPEKLSEYPELKSAIYKYQQITTLN